MKKISTNDCRSSPKKRTRKRTRPIGWYRSRGGEPVQFCIDLLRLNISLLSPLTLSGTNYSRDRITPSDVKVCFLLILCVVVVPECSLSQGPTQSLSLFNLFSVIGTRTEKDERVYKTQGRTGEQNRDVCEWSRKHIIVLEFMEDKFKVTEDVN